MKKILRVGTVGQVKELIRENPNFPFESLEETTTNLLPIHVAAQALKWDLVVYFASLCPETVILPSAAERPILHSMIYHRASSDYILNVIKSCPQACSNSNNEGVYALHIAIAQNAEMIVIESLIQTDPRVLQCTDTINGSLPLHLAMKNHTRPEIVRKMVQLYPEAISQTDFDGRLPIHVAIDNDCLWPLIEPVVHVTVCMVLDGERFLPLHLACLTHSWTIVNRLAKLCPETIRERDPIGDLPLHIALANKCWKTAELLAVPETMCVPDRCDRLPLHVALASYCTENSHLIEILIDGYEGGIRYQDSFQNLPVHKLIQVKNWSLVEKCIYPTCSSIPNRIGSTTLMLAAQYGAPLNIINVLATQPYDIATTPTPLDLALKHGHWKTALGIADKFPEQGAIKNEQKLLPVQVCVLQNSPIWLIHRLCVIYPQAAAQLNTNGNTMACAACISRKWPLLIEFVQSYPHVASIPNTKDQLLFETALELCAPSEVMIEIIKAFPIAMVNECWCLNYLLDKYRLTAEEMEKLASCHDFMSAKDIYGNTPLHVAVNKSSHAFVTMLLHHGSNIFQENIEQEMPVSKLSLATLVLDKKFISARDYFGQTPLFHAVAAGDLSTVRMLLQHGADPSTADYSNKRAIDILPKHMALGELHSEIALASGRNLVVHEKYIYSRESSRPVALDISTSGRYVHLFFFDDKSEWKQCIEKSHDSSSASCTLLLDTFSSTGNKYCIVTEAGTGRCARDIDSISQHEGLVIARTLFFTLHALYEQFNYVHTRLSDMSVVEMARGCYKLTDAHAMIKSGQPVYLPLDYFEKEKRILPPEIISQDPHGTFYFTTAANIWTAACIVYQVFCGTSFMHQLDPKTVTLADVVKRIDQSSKLPLQLKPLLKRALHPDPNERSSLSTFVTSPVFESIDKSISSSHYVNDDTLPISVAEIVVLTMDKQKKELTALLGQLREQTKYSKCVAESIQANREEFNAQIMQSKKDQYIDRIIKKEFDDGLVYRGKVVKFDSERGYYTIEYEDGDSEEMDQAELVQLLDTSPKNKLRGRFVKHRDNLMIGQMVYIGESKKLIGAGTIVAIPTDDPAVDDVVYIRLQKIFTGTKNDEKKRNLLKDSQQNGFIPWPVHDCFIPKSSCN